MTVLKVLSTCEFEPNILKINEINFNKFRNYDL